MGLHGNFTPCCNIVQTSWSASGTKLTHFNVVMGPGKEKVANILSALLRCVPRTSLEVHWLRLPSNDRSVGSISGQGAKILHTSWPKKPKHKIEAIFNKFNKYFKSGPYAKKKKDRHVPECKKKKYALGEVWPKSLMKCLRTEICWGYFLKWDKLLGVCINGGYKYHMRANYFSYLFDNF